MNTLNLVLMIVLSAMIGFAMGNVYGQQKMKIIFNSLLDKLANGLKNIGINQKGEDQK